MSVRSTGEAPGLPRLRLAHPSGSTAEIHLQGAHVTSWVPAGASEALFVSRESEFRPGTAIRGGIPVIFPQFAGLGPLPKHGFARTLPWRGTGRDQSPATASLELSDSEATRAVWPFAFRARLRVELGERALSVRLTIANTDSRDFSFTAALHTYLRVAAAARARVEGLSGVRYRSALEGVEDLPDPEPWVAFTGEVDRVYLDAPPELRVSDVAGGRTFRVSARGFRDVVVWNPGEARAAALPDMAAEEHQQMVCVEAARVRVPVRLLPGEEWSGEQRLAL